MAYEMKPGQGSLFLRADKKSPRYPDYTGTMKDADGVTWNLAAWIKEGTKGREDWLSISISVPRERDDNDTPF